MNKFIEQAKENARRGMENKEGGPFGAVIVDKSGKIISNGNNKVLVSHDPTAHAEITAIREASKVLGTHDLTGCKIYISCEPCPMCLSAIIWSNIKEVYYACTKEDADRIGFRDNIIYDYLNGKNKNILEIKQLDRDECIDIMDKYQKENGVIY